MTPEQRKAYFLMLVQTSTMMAAIEANKPTYPFRILSAAMEIGASSVPDDYAEAASDFVDYAWLMQTYRCGIDWKPIPPPWLPQPVRDLLGA